MKPRRTSAVYQDAGMFTPRVAAGEEARGNSHQEAGNGNPQLTHRR